MNALSTRTVVRIRAAARVLNGNASAIALIALSSVPPHRWVSEPTIVAFLPSTDEKAAVCALQNVNSVNRNEGARGHDTGASAVSLRDVLNMARVGRAGPGEGSSPIGVDLRQHFVQHRRQLRHHGLQ